MGFFSFLGRVLFASIFIISAWQMFNELTPDGGPAAKQLAPKVNEVREVLGSKLGIQLHNIEVKHLVVASVAIKGIGGLLFIFGSSFGAYLLLLHLAFTTPFLYGFYNYAPDQPEFFTLLSQFLQNVSLFGALLFFLGMKITRTPSSKRPIKKKGVKPKTY